MSDQRDKDLLDELLRKCGMKETEREILRNSYLQKNRAESAAFKLSRPKKEMELWYLAMSLCLAFQALECAKTSAVRHSS